MTALRLKQAWKIWPIGHVIPDMPGGEARALISRGIAEEVDRAKPESRFSKVLTAPANRMMPSPVKRSK